MLDSMTIHLNILPSCIQRDSSFLSLWQLTKNTIRYSDTLFLESYKKYVFILNAFRL